MTDEQFNQLNKKLDRIIKMLEKTVGPEDESPVNQLLRKATSKETNDKDYCQALVKLNKLPFALSAKQISWLLCYVRNHSECGQSIENFLKKQFEKHQNKNEYIEQISSVLRTKYSNENNMDFIQKLIFKLKEI